MIKKEGRKKGRKKRKEKKNEEKKNLTQECNSNQGKVAEFVESRRPAVNATDRICLYRKCGKSEQ